MTLHAHHGLPSRAAHLPAARMAFIAFLAVVILLAIALCIWRQHYAVSLLLALGMLYLAHIFRRSRHELAHSRIDAQPYGIKASA